MLSAYSLNSYQFKPHSGEVTPIILHSLALRSLGLIAVFPAPLVKVMKELELSHDLGLPLVILGLDELIQRNGGVRLDNDGLCILTEEVQLLLA